MKQSHFKKLLLVSLLLVSNTLLASQILTTTPVTYMLASQLMAGTAIQTEYLAPKRYTLNRLPNWFKGKGESKVLRAAKKASVVITIASIWPQDPLYIYARQANLHVLEIDASQAKTVQADAVAIRKKVDKSVSSYAWLNSHNLSVMSKIVADDLKRVWPQHSAVINQNQLYLLDDIQRLIKQQQQFLIEKDIDAVLVLSDQLQDFVSGNQLFVVKQISQPELQWSEQQKADLVNLLKSDSSLWVVSSKKSSQFIKQQLPNFEQFLYVDVIDRWGKQGIDDKAPLNRWFLGK